MLLLRSILFYIFTFFMLVIAAVLGAFFFVAHNHIVDFSMLEHNNPGRPSILLDDEGNEWARFQLDRREPIRFDQMPEHLINTFIAAEDWDFFNHSGISWKGIIRSILVNAYYARKVQGASTITQQLVKLLFFDSQKTFKRKIKEQLYALLIERQFTKKQILQTYLNNVYFGCGIYGVEAASQRFWSKHAHELSIDEAAVLAGIIRSPGRYCPLLYPLSCEKRRNIVLRKMLRLGFISQEEYEKAEEKLLVIEKGTHQACAPHLRESIRIFLEELVGKATLYGGGLRIQTTVNRKIQMIAQQAFHDECSRLRQERGKNVDGALIAIDCKTGAIKALVGGFDFATSKFNRALQARRQIGSVFKVVVYAAALQEGMTFTDTEIDEPFELVQGNQIWHPNNVDKRFSGQVTLAYALSHSNNIVAIKTLLRVGVHKVIALAKKCRIGAVFHPYPSLALGCVDATLQEAVGMFNVFANNGMYVEPHSIAWVKDQWGTKIFKISLAKEQVLSSQIAGKVASVLRLGVNRVRKIFGKKWIQSEAIGKTGTANNFRTNWFVGSTPTLTTAVYIGYDDNHSMGKNIYPLHTVLPIWLRLNKAVEISQQTFTYDPALHEVVINERTGMHARRGDPGAITILI